jgi:PIN domain nuclease of toxin-antitoxin system
MPMKLLLDSSTVVWFLEGAPQLSETAAGLIESLESHSMVSSVTPWELAVKVGLGKLRLPYSLGEDFDATLESLGFELLPLSRAALERTARLPDYHRDPFDRLLIAEALEHSATLVSRNEIFDAYGVKRVW